GPFLPIAVASTFLNSRDWDTETGDLFMRWNCPHCEALVTAGIDFEATKKAYVRCAKCGGMALIHRSAALADYVKARRLEEEAQLEAEILIANAAREKA